MLTAQRRRTSPTAQIRRLGVFAGISVLAMVHQVLEDYTGLLSDVITSLSLPLEPAVGPIVRSLPTLASRMTKHCDADNDPDCRQFKGQA
jgi:hypothetical protein